MARSRRHKPSSVRPVGGPAALVSKKNVAAAVLLIIMGIMWVRVLTGSKPKSSAAKTPVVEKKEEPKKSVNIHFIDIPVIPGRNDIIDHDFFAVQDWRNFSKVPGASGPATNSEVQVISPNWNQEVFARMTQKLKLEGVFPPNAMINDQLLQVGDSITVREGMDVCTFDVVRIGEDSVVVAREGHELTLTLELAQSNDVGN